MTLDGVDLKPVEGRVVVEFDDSVDDDKEEAGAGRFAGDVPRREVSDDAVMAEVIAAGPKTNVKKGDVVLVSRWALSSPAIGKGKYRIIYASDILASAKQ
jgi:co-chaperonin GroES (HSP10)